MNMQRSLLLTRHIGVDSLGPSASLSKLHSHYTYLRVAAKGPALAQISYAGGWLFALTLRDVRVSHENSSTGGVRPVVRPVGDSLSRPSMSKIAYSIWARRSAAMVEWILIYCSSSTEGSMLRLTSDIKYTMSTSTDGAPAARFV
jgi:hypothetical protein